MVGGGILALRKIRLITAAGAQPRVVAPQLRKEIAELVEQHQGQLHRRAFKQSDIKDVSLIFSATDDEKLNQHIYQLACSRDLPINTVDNQKLCTFITPALIDREPLLVAFSTAGQSPVMARRLRADMEARLPHNYGRLVRFMGSLRPQVKDSLTEDKRRRFYERLLDSELPHLVYGGQMEEAQQLVEKMLKRKNEKAGEVWLAGAGPGAADLLTLQTLRLMHHADVILYDRLVSDEIMQMARRDADKISVGKPNTGQEDINRKMIEYAQQGKQVLRLKGGDPGIYGRLAEEIAALTEAGIRFHIAPGVTAALACAAYGGVPLTDRESAHGVSFLNFSHLHRHSMMESLNGLVQSGHTLVVYMGVENMEEGAKALLAARLAAKTPCLIVESVGFPHQRRLKTSLADLSHKARQAEIGSPAIIIIGTVAENALF